MTIELHTAGEAHLKQLISAGKYDNSSPWSFDGADGDKLLGDKGDDWERYANVHLGENTAADDMTKARWEYPAAKADGDSDKVYRHGLIAAKDRAGQQGDKDVEAAANRLLEQIDEKEGKSSSSASVSVTERNMAVRDLPRLMTRIFGTPLLMAPAKVEVIMGALGPRLGLTAGAPVDPAKFAAMFGADDDTGDDDEDDPYDLTEDGIATISVDGTLVYKSSWLGALSGLTGYGQISDAINAAVADQRVKGILLMVDSYGGECNGCFDLSDAIFAARQAKPIYGVAADDAYSAAYAQLSACSKVFVSRTSGVGSVGVVALHVDQSGADKMDGLKYTYIHAGDKKIDGNPHAPLTSAAKTSMQQECDRLWNLFAGSVAKYRSVSVESVLAMQAGCFFGEEAVGAKLADAVGTPADAMAALRADLAARSGQPPAVSAMLAEHVIAGPSGEAVLSVPGNVDDPPAALALDTIPVAAEAAAPAAVPERPGQVIDFAAERAKITGEITTNALEIIELCTLAGMADRAAGYMRAGLSVEGVRNALQTIRAQTSEARRVGGHITAEAGSSERQLTSDSWSKAFADARQ